MSFAFWLYVLAIVAVSVLVCNGACSGGSRYWGAGRKSFACYVIPCETLLGVWFGLVVVVVVVCVLFFRHLVVTWRQSLIMLQEQCRKDV